MTIRSFCYATTARAAERARTNAPWPARIANLGKYTARERREKKTRARARELRARQSRVLGRGAAQFDAFHERVVLAHQPRDQLLRRLLQMPRDEHLVQHVVRLVKVEH